MSSLLKLIRKWNIEDITQTLKTRGSAQALELRCKDQDETKIIEISLKLIL